jgi:catechol 2,3-dioxygenase-like lactoylglutathione lyase family enzyme
MRIDRLDRVVLTVADVQATIGFYSRVLGMEPVESVDGCHGLAFGDGRIDLRQVGRESGPRARRPTRGSADLCFVVGTPLEQVIAELISKAVRVERGPGGSVYLRDPDGNLIELSVYS